MDKSGRIFEERLCLIKGCSANDDDDDDDEEEEEEIIL
jgi:hypothetical protein